MGMNNSNILKLATKYKLLARGKKNIDKQILNSFKTFKDRLYYLVENGYDILGIGSARCVLLVNQRKVIKLAMNEKGIGQNRTEFDVLSNKSEWFPKVFDKAPDNSWIEVELVKTLTSLDQVAMYFHTSRNVYLKGLEVAGNIPAKSNLLRRLENTIKNLKISAENKVGLTDGQLDKSKINDVTKLLSEDPYYVAYVEIISNEKLMSFLQTLITFDLRPIEFEHDVSHYGMTGDARLVISDVGYDSNVINNFYLSKEKEKPKDPFAYEYGKPVNIYDKYNKLIPEKKYISKDPKNIISE